MPVPRPVELPFTPESARQVLQWGLVPDTSPYSHRQIADWCDRYWCQYLHVDAPAGLETLLPVLTEVDVQWDLFLANTYSLEQLRSSDLDRIVMPVEWFSRWLRQAELEPASTREPDPPRS